MKQITEAVVTGGKQGAADQASKRLLKRIKKAAGKNYPAVLCTPLGSKVEPFIVPLVVSALAETVGEFLCKRASLNFTGEDIRNLMAGGHLKDDQEYIGRVFRVADVANLALTQATASFTSTELDGLLNMAEGLLGSFVEGKIHQTD